jgi:hypothetical protein
MRLEFDPAAHAYRLDGRPVPGVTAVLDPLLELWRVDPALLEAAAEFGSHVHQAVDLFNRGELDEESLDPALEPPLRGWKAFLRDTGTVILETEQRVYHDRARYAGTLDNVGLMPGRRGRGEVRALIDVKSGVVPITVGAQTAAYEEARRSMGLAPCRRRLCVQLKSEAPFYRVHELTEPGDFSLFLSALNIYRFKEKHHATAQH